MIPHPACRVVVEDRPVLRAVAIWKSFDGVEVLKGIDLTVRERECVFIIGPSGSGKSTFLRCLNRLEEPDSGAIELDGKAISGPGVDLNRVRQRIGMVFQSFNLYPHLSALNNVTIALRLVRKMSREEADAQGRAALQRVGLAQKCDAMPATLSGGQQQRVAIARAVVMRPRVMLFDEPTSALDPELVGSVIDAMRDLKQEGMTMIVVTHELRFAREAGDRLIFMADGKKLVQGRPAEVLDAPDHPRLAEFLSRVN